MANHEVFIGIDVSKEKLDLAVRPSSIRKQFSNNEEGIKSLVDFVKSNQPELIVLESTGGMELAAANALSAENLPVSIINPRQGRDFTKATGQIAKTDTIDSSSLAHFAEAIRPPIRAVKSQERVVLSALRTRRRQLVEMHTAELNRLASSPIKTRRNIEEHMEWIEKQINNLNYEIAEIIQSTANWRALDEIFQSVTGIGPVTSSTIISELPEIGTVNPKKIAALAGVAPLNKDSGKRKGKRCVWGGRGKVRSVLYMATLCATRHNPVISVFYDRLIDAGKLPKVAITACMRKLLTILNAMARDGKKWQPALEKA